MALSFSTVLADFILNSAGVAEKMINGALFIYGGTQPATPETAAGALYLAKITVASGALTADPSAGAHLHFGSATLGVLPKASEVWSGVVQSRASMVATWYRFFDEAAIIAWDSNADAADTTNCIFDGTVGLAGSGADLILASTTLVAGSTLTIDTFNVALPLT